MRGEADPSSLGATDVFDAFAERYDRWYDKPFGRSAFSLEKSCIQPVCKDLKKPFLEVGVGTGRFAEALEIEYGIDVSFGVSKIAKTRGISVIVCRGEKLPFRSESFGAVFVIVTLCFVDDPLEALKESARVLQNDGSIILGLILRESPWASYYKKKGEECNVFYKIAKFYSFDELKAMVEQAELKITEIRSTIFQEPTESPLHFENPRKGYSNEAGFVVVRLGKAHR